MHKIIKYSVISVILISVIVNFTLFSLATIKKEDYKLIYKKILSQLIKREKKIGPPKLFVPKRLGILKPNQLLKSELFEPDVSIKEIEKMRIRGTDEFVIRPEIYIASLNKDEEWQPPKVPDADHPLQWIVPEEEYAIIIYGQQKLGFTYGMAHFLGGRKSVDSVASSSAIHRGFKPSQSLEIHIKGKIGKKVEIDIDSSGRQEQDTYKVQYTALEEDEFIQKIVAGNIPVSIPGTAYASGSTGGVKSSFGIKATAQKGDWKFQAIASMTRGVTEVKHFKGTSQLIVRNIKDFDYYRMKYFVLNQGNPIDSGTLKIYLDDHIKDNNIGTEKIVYLNQTNDCGYLINGADYIVDYQKGFVEFKRYISTTHDIFVTYTRNNGVTNYPFIDPSTNFHADYRTTNINNLDDNKIYTFLYSKSRTSPYEYKGVYNLGSQNIQKEDKDFVFKILDKDLRDVTENELLFSEIDVENYAYGGKSYYIDERSGYIIFSESMPFANGSHYNEYPDRSPYIDNPDRRLSYYYIHLEYRYESRDFRLHWDVIPESEKVFLNGRKLTRNNDYTIDYKTGVLEFAPSVIITPDSEIDIVYEYLPFGGGLQQILAGLRIDYTPSDWLSLGSVGFYNGKQSPSEVPTPRNASDNRWVGSLFGKASFDKEKVTKGLDFILPWKIIDAPITLSLQGEYAGSYYNINTFGQAMLDDFEGTIESYSCSVREKDWYLCAAPITNMEPDRGKIKYNEYYKEKTGGGAELLRFGDPDAVTNIPYVRKPGPYNVDNGHLEPFQIESESVQRSLVFDYDFTVASNKNKAWVGVIKRDAFRGAGKDFKDFTDLVLWIKHESQTPGKEVKFRIDLGTFSEDIDSDGYNDEELGKYDEGFPFNPPNGIATTIGGGAKYDKESQANNVLDREDLDNNGYLDKDVSAEIISFPCGQGRSYALTEKKELELILEANKGWKSYRITLAKDKLNKEERDYLKRIKHVRIMIENIDSGDTGIGKVLVQEMRFAGLTWKERFINEYTYSSNNQKYFTAYIISTYDNADYRNNSLRKHDEDDYDDLHGSKTEEEAAQENEQTLVLEYSNLYRHDFSITMKSNYNQEKDQYSAAYVARNYSYPVDMRYYKKIKFWVYVDNSVANLKGEYVFLRFGGLNAYYEFRKQLDWTGWKKIEVDLRSEEFMELEASQGYHGLYGPGKSFRVVNIPNLKQVNRISIGIYGSETQKDATGRVWVNDLYLDDVETLGDTAYNYSVNFALLEHLSLSYSHSFKGKHFSSIGGMGSGRKSTSDTISGKWTSVKWMPVNGTWSRSISETDTEDIFVPINLQGWTIAENINGSVNFNLPSNPLLKSLLPQYWPNINLSGSMSWSTNKRPIYWLGQHPDASVYKLSRISESYSYAWNGSMKVPLFDSLLDSNVTFQFGYSLSHSEAKTITYSPITVTNIIAANTNIVLYYADYNTHEVLNFSENRSWNAGGSYSTGGLSLTPKYKYSYSLSRNKDATNWNLIRRSRDISTGVTLPKLLIFSPVINYQFGYSESGFNFKGPRKNPRYRNPNSGKILVPLENSSYDFDDEKELYKNATTSQSYSLNIGTFNIDWFIFKNFTPSYNQTMGFSQSGVSVITNTFSKTWNEFAERFLAQVPGYYFYIPFINPRYKVFKFARESGEGHYDKTSISFGNTFSSRFGLNFFDVSKWGISYSLNQNVRRSYNSYSISHSWRISGSSSLDLMKIFEFWIFRQKKGGYQKSSALRYELSVNKVNSFLQKSTQLRISPTFNFSYKWLADKSIKWNLTYTYDQTYHNKYESFFKSIEDDEDLGEDFRKEIEQPIQPFPDKVGHTLKFSTSYSYTTHLAEYWTPPIFFKKPIKLGYKLNHTTRLTYNKKIYDYGQSDSGDDNIHPKVTVHQIILDHALSLVVSKNISGGANAKVAYDMTRYERGSPGHDNDDIEHILSWQIGVNLIIKF